MKGEVDAATLTEPHITLAEKKGCRIICSAFFHGTEVASDRVDAETYAAFNRAVREAVRRINANKRAYLHYFIDYHGKKDPEIAALKVEDLRESRLVVCDPAPIPLDEMQRTYDWLKSWGMLEETASPLATRQYGRAALRPSGGGVINIRIRNRLPVVSQNSARGASGTPPLPEGLRIRFQVLFGCRSPVIRSPLAREPMRAVPNTTRTIWPKMANKAAEQREAPMALTKGVRRVVTTHDAGGKAVIGFDDIRPVSGGEPELGVEVYNFWITDETPADMSKKEDRAARKVGIPPPANGSIFRIVDFHPSTKAMEQLDPNFLSKIVGQDNKDHAKPGTKPPRHPGMHKTRSIDYAVVLSGEIDMLLDDSEVTLKAGDVLVQQGTIHAWINKGKETCRIAFILIDAKQV